MEPLGKSKPIALVIAVTAPPLTWLYTYGKDKIKFWVGFLASMLGFGGGAIGFVGVIISWPNPGDSQLQPMFALLSINVIVAIWAIVDTATKPTQWYEQFYN